DEMRAVVDAAETWGTYVLVHAYMPRAIQQAVAAGVRCIDHGQLADEPTVELMADKGIWWSIQPFLDDIQKRSAALIRGGGSVVSVVGTAEAGPAYGMAIDFVVKSERAQLTEIVQRVRDGRLRTNIGTSRPSTMPLRPSTRQSDARGRRSSACVRKDSGTATSPGVRV